MSDLPDPTLARIRRARARAGHTQAQAAELVWASLRAWEDWEGGRRTMPLTAWAVYLHRTGQWTLPTIDALMPE